MKNLKFRVWDKEKKVMFEIDDEQFLAGHDYFSNERFIPLQFIGLSDKNGKEVYEGDVFYAKMISTSPKGTYVEVIYDAPSFDVVDKKGDNCWNAYLVIIGGEVIGNIYENENLINRTL